MGPLASQSRRNERASSAKPATSDSSRFLNPTCARQRTIPVIEMNRKVTRDRQIPHSSHLASSGQLSILKMPFSLHLATLGIKRHALGFFEVCTELLQGGEAARGLPSVHPAAPTTGEAHTCSLLSSSLASRERLFRLRQA